MIFRAKVGGPMNLMRYDFEWDPVKATSNVRKHKVGFERAGTIFRDRNLLSIPDEEHSETEERWITMGLDDTGVLLAHKFESVGKKRFRESGSSRPERQRRKKQNNMKKEYDFSKGKRGKFHNPNGEFSLPIYLEPEVAEFVQKLSVKKHIDRSQLVNQLLEKDMELIEL